MVRLLLCAYIGNIILAWYNHPLKSHTPEIHTESWVSIWALSQSKPDREFQFRPLNGVFFGARSDHVSLTDTITFLQMASLLFPSLQAWWKPSCYHQRVIDRVLTVYKKLIPTQVHFRGPHYFGCTQHCTLRSYLESPSVPLVIRTLPFSVPFITLNSPDNLCLLDTPT